jgi:hypothetical protein
MSSDLIGGYLTFYLNQPMKWADFRLDALLADTMLTKLYTTGPLCSTLSHNLVGQISAHFKNTPCISYFIKRTPMRFPCFKAYFLEVTSHWRMYKNSIIGKYFLRKIFTVLVWMSMGFDIDQNHIGFLQVDGNYL